MGGGVYSLVKITGDVQEDKIAKNDQELRHCSLRSQRKVTCHRIVCPSSFISAVSLSSAVHPRMLMKPEEGKLDFSQGVFAEIASGLSLAYLTCSE